MSGIKKEPNTRSTSENIEAEKKRFYVKQSPAPGSQWVQRGTAVFVKKPKQETKKEESSFKKVKNHPKTPHSGKWPSSLKKNKANARVNYDKKRGAALSHSKKQRASLNSISMMQRKYFLSQSARRHSAQRRTNLMFSPKNRGHNSPIGNRWDPGIPRPRVNRSLDLAATNQYHRPSVRILPYNSDMQYESIPPSMAPYYKNYSPRRMSHDERNEWQSQWALQKKTSW